MCQRDPRQCIIPPYINERLAKSDDPAVRSRAVANMQAAATMRAMRVMSQAMPSLMASASAGKTKNRQVFDAKGKDLLPGTLARSEGQAKTADKAVNEAYDFSGDTYDFYDQLFGRNSLDNAGMTLSSSVHVAETDDTGAFVPMNNAFWNGEQRRTVMATAQSSDPSQVRST
jgi:Zn-dependent metalloprotease